MAASDGQRRLIVGVDVGGTFTDLVAIDTGTGEVATAKVSSNRGDEAVGFISGLERIGRLDTIAAVVHGTTVGTNALLERKGARVGVITTAGFRDVLEMRRRDRRRTWGLSGDFEPIAERDLRIEVRERTLADGTVRLAVDEGEIARAVSALLAAGAEALAIVFVNAYANPATEREALRVARSLWPSGHVCASHEILPEIREFERSSTTAINAYLQPVVSAYIAKLDDGLAGGGFSGSFHIMQSNGGIMSTATARRLPVRTALSGPAAGVIAAAATARASGFDDVITADLGGTSFDVSLVESGKVGLSSQTTIDFGLVIRTPMIEILTIGAGGGSIAKVDAGGLLQVGPESAGSRPGPVAYGQGNTRPTLTDANIVLGRIDAGRPIGGALTRLDRDAACAAIAREVGDPLGLDVMTAAEAIVRVANARMAGAIRLLSIERGHDPGKFAIVPFGGGGALHVGALIREVGLRAALVPRYPGLTSALGCLLADVRHDQISTVNLPLDGLDVANLDKRMSGEGIAARAVVEHAGLPVTGIDVTFELDMHYVGQTHTVAVQLPLTLGASGTGLTQEIVRTSFESAYSRAFARLLPGIPVRIASLRVAAIGRRPQFDLQALAPQAAAPVSSAELGARRVWFSGLWHEVRTYRRLSLPVGARIEGPAILEQPDTTIAVEPGLAAEVDRLGNLIITS